MRAALVRNYRNLEAAEVERPEPAADDVLVRVPRRR